MIAKFGVPPASIPDYLALVGDAADGYPGLPGWGAKSAAAVLARYGHLESIPADWRTWGVNAASPARLPRTLARERDHAFLFRDLATLRTDIPLFDSVDDLHWNGPTPTFALACRARSTPRRKARSGAHTLQPFPDAPCRLPPNAKFAWLAAATLPCRTRARCCSRTPATRSSIWRATTSPWPTAPCAARAAGPTCSSATRTASTASSSSRSARRRRGRHGSRWSRCAFLPAAPPRRSCRAMRRRSCGWRISPASSSTRTRCAPTIWTIPTSSASISIRCPASRGPRFAMWRAWCSTILDEFGLVGWPKTSGSRGMHVYVRIERRWTFDRGAAGGARAGARGRTARAGAGDEQVVEGRAPRRVSRLQPERQGPHDRERVLGPANRRCARLRAADVGRSGRVRSAGLHAGDDGRRVSRRWATAMPPSTTIRVRSTGCSSFRRATSGTGWVMPRGRLITRSSPASPPGCGRHAGARRAAR